MQLEAEWSTSINECARTGGWLILQARYNVNRWKAKEEKRTSTTEPQ